MVNKIALVRKKVRFDSEPSFIPCEFEKGEIQGFMYSTWSLRWIFFKYRIKNWFKSLFKRKVKCDFCGSRSHNNLEHFGKMRISWSVRRVSRSSQDKVGSSRSYDVSTSSRIGRISRF